MPRYFFDIWTGDEEAPDEDGTELPNLDAVRAELCEAVAELAKEQLRARAHVERREVRIKVRDANGRHLLQARLQFNLEPLGQDTSSAGPSTDSPADTRH